jgi:hypothetical protein
MSAADRPGGGLLKDIGFAFAVCLVLLLLAELVLRLAPGFTDPGRASGLRMCEPHPTRIWQYKSGFSQRHRMQEFSVEVRTNSWRLRGAEVEALAEAVRILVIGDSFTFGWGVQESQRYSEVLGGLLREATPGRRVEVVNAGYWGYTFDQQYLLLRELLPRLRPQLVVQGVHPGHVPTLQGHRLEVSESGEPVAVRNPAITVDEKGAVRFRSDWLDRPPLGLRVLGTAARAFLNWRLSRSQMTRELSLYAPGSTLFDREWEMTGDVLAHTGRLLQNEGIPWVVLLIPRDFQVAREEWNSSEDLGRGLDLELPTRRMAALVAGNGAAVVDLLPEFRRLYSPDLYFATDPHWSPAGHALAARSILTTVETALARDAAPGPGRATRPR